MSMKKLKSILRVVGWILTLGKLSSGVKKTPKEDSSKVIDKKDVGPLVIVTTEEGSYITMGNYRLTEKKTVEECEASLRGIDWLFVIQLIATMIEIGKELEKKAFEFTKNEVGKIDPNYEKIDEYERNIRNNSGNDKSNIVEFRGGV